MEVPVENGEEKDKNFFEVCGLISALQEYKAKTYGNSWCKHGEAVSIFGNISRKYDRIEQIIKNNVEKMRPYPKADSEESLAETVADLATYCILWMTWIKKNRAEEYDHWSYRIIKSVSPETFEKPLCENAQDVNCTKTVEA